ncbi:TadE/TadG family type IV pilus assembly protein [Rathayibacter sp. YIM 133350]|uniref:TadE/TadG family type IV pilus assembly protein n=1 Tax=Rathayibacter sp. YIM 133350 TaxID=3131992 RepID=UPI00307F5B52
MRRLRQLLDDEAGSAVAEFVMVSALLTALALAVLQLGFALLIRNTVLDAAAEGARYAALADTGLAAGAQRTRELITTALGPDYAAHIEARYGNYAGHASTEVRVRTPLPLAGLFGPDRAMEVVGHASLETLDGG